MTDSTKPGPDAARIAELKRKLAWEKKVAPASAKIHEWETELAHLRTEDERAQLLQCLDDGPNDKQIRAEIAKRDAELARLRNEQPKGGDAVREASRDDDEAAMVWNKIAPSEPQDVREAVTSVLRRYGIAKSSAEHVAVQVLVALAQSNAQPSLSQDALNAGLAARDKALREDINDPIGAFFIGAQTAHAWPVSAQSDAQPVGQDFRDTVDRATI